jgi:hypothetical protein
MRDGRGDAQGGIGLVTIVLSMVIGIVVGGGFMALIAARHIGAEAARQFDRGVAEGRWRLVDAGAIQPVDEAARRRRVTALA